ncbi:MAG: dihydrofolate reductase family protein [Clostridia bacterium]|nr:dihydrofolate reductase family protein [Clostridia bacterium]
MKGRMKMERPYVICHMTQSIDGKVAGKFLCTPGCQSALDAYYEMHRGYNADAFACGRVTMVESFTNGYYPDLTKYEPVEEMSDYIAKGFHTFFAISLDRYGRVGWQDSCIHDEDPGYDNAHIIEIVSEQVDRRYLTYLRSIGVSYIVAGGGEHLEIDNALFKLKSLFGINKLLLEGGSIVNGWFEREDLIDEISVVVAPTIASSSDSPLFYNGKSLDLTHVETRTFKNGVVALRYKR